MSTQPSAPDRGWIVVDSKQTSIGAQCWTLRHGSTIANVAGLPHGAGLRILFVDPAYPHRAVAHAARCYAAVCDACEAHAEGAPGSTLDVRPVSASGGSVDVNGADALATAVPYFGGALGSAPRQEAK